MKPFVIGIIGGSGSGKTSFIRAIRASFAEQEVCIISQDDYYLSKEEQKQDAKGVHNFDRPKSIDKKGFIRDVESLISGTPVTIQEYTFNNRSAESKEIILQPAPIIIVEGLFVFHFKKMRSMLDLKLFFHAKENLKVIRRVHRDQVERNYPIDDVLYRYEHHVLPAFEKYVLPFKEKADVIINNNDNFKAGLDLMNTFIRGKLTERVS